MSTYEPGTVAIATVRGVEGMRVFRYVSTAWLSAQTVEMTRIHPDTFVTDVRPLVVLDLAPMYDGLDMGGWDYVVRALRDQSSKAVITRDDIADQIEAQTKAPKPTEPEGLGAVVEDENGDCWIRLGGGPAAWVLAHSSPSNRDTIAYAGIRASRVLSKGVES